MAAVNAVPACAFEQVAVATSLALVKALRVFKLGNVVQPDSSNARRQTAAPAKSERIRLVTESKA